MSQPADRPHPNLRDEAKTYYRDKENIAAKWLDQYGNVSRDNDYQRNRACMGEVFNMLDVVMDICIEDFRKAHTIVSIEMAGKTPVYTFALPESDRACANLPDHADTITFSMPTTFARRVRTLRSIGYPISNELLYDTRLLRNETTHGNQTIILRHMELGYSETMKALLSMADALICLGMLDPALRTPSFDMLRVKEGSTLLGGVYTIGPLIGEGGMSRVYKAVQKRTGKQFAVKELKPGAYSEDVIMQECDTLSRIHHPAIPQIYDTFSENDTFYIVMDFVEGVPLDRYMDDLTDERRDLILKGLCDVLSYLHSDEVSLVFADLSPGNILVEREGIPHLIDFGISGRKEERQHIPAATPGYSAPEVFSEKILDERTDIYSFGQILRLLYTGLSPLEKTDVSAFDLIPDPVTAEVVERCTSRSPQERYGSIEEVRAILFPDTEVRGEEEENAGRRRKILTACVIAAALFIAAPVSYRVTHPGGAGNQVAGESSGSELVTMEEAGVEDHAVEWTDEGLEAGVRDIVGIKDREIMLSDLWDLTELMLIDCDIKSVGDLRQLGGLPNLTTVYLNDNKIEDVTPLSELTSVQALSLDSNRISDISALGSLQELHTLFAGRNSIRDLSAVSALSHLKNLNLQSNPVEDLSPIMQLHDLEYLNLGSTQISECSWLENFKDLTSLALPDNDISDISALSVLDQLQDVDLEGNQIEDISALSGLTELRHISLENNPLSSLKALENNTQLQYISVNGCRIDDLDGIQDLTLITEFKASDNTITDLAPLAGLENLEYLQLENNQIEGDLDDLKDLHALTKLYLAGNRITDIKALSGLKKLQAVSLEGNPVKDYSPLDELGIEYYSN